MPRRVAICLAVLIAGAQWLGAASVQNSTTPVARPVVAAGGYLYVSTLRPASGVADDIGAQTQSVLAQLKTALEATGSSLGQLCSVTVTLRRAADFAAMNQAYAAVFLPATPEAPAPPTRTTVVGILPSRTLIEVSAIALPNGARRVAMQPPTWGKNPRPYSYIIKTDDLVFFSGLVSRRGTDDAVVTGSVKVQAETILDNAGTLLETAGLTYDDVVSARVYLTSPYDFQEMNDTYRNYFAKDAPARGTAVVELMNSDANIEITLIASQQPKKVIGGQAANGLPVSLAIEAGPRVWLSAVIGDTEKHAGKVAEQTRGAFEHLRPTLALAGLNFSDVAEMTVYMVDTYEQPALDGVFREFFPSNPPARSLTGARLVIAPGLVELLATAVRR
jgi:2-iminobutanoate/2-iminopropanoate deaminase